MEMDGCKPAKRFRRHTKEERKKEKARHKEKKRQEKKEELTERKEKVVTTVAVQTEQRDQVGSTSKQATSKPAIKSRGQQYYLCRGRVMVF